MINWKEKHLLGDILMHVGYVVAIGVILIFPFVWMKIIVAGLMCIGFAFEVHQNHENRLKVRRID